VRSVRGRIGGLLIAYTRRRVDASGLWSVRYETERRVGARKWSCASVGEVVARA
jgi:hypothetical protein